MEISKDLILLEVIKLSRSSEHKYKEGDYKGALKDKREAKSILNSPLCDNYIRNKLKEELSNLYYSRFDLIYDHKIRLDKFKKKEIIDLLEKKSKDRYKEGDYKGAIKALRRSEKYQ